MNEIIEKIYETKSVVGLNGEILKLHSEVDRREGAFLYDTIRSNDSIKKTLEVGCAYGLSSLHICEALRNRVGAEHTIIDPFQHIQWAGVGVKNLSAAGIDFFKLVEVKSEFALPHLAEQSEGQFDFIFIDGWHTFDHTLVDCFYATRLLRVGGTLVIDDVSMPAIKKVVDFLISYPCYRIIGSVSEKRTSAFKIAIARTVLFPLKITGLTSYIKSSLYHKAYDKDYTTMIAFEKIAEDNRNWNWYDDNF